MQMRFVILSLLNEYDDDDVNYTKGEGPRMPRI